MRTRLLITCLFGFGVCETAMDSSLLLEALSCLTGLPVSARAASPGDKAPGQKAPGEKTPGQKAPGEKAPGEKAPGQEAPGQEAPGEKAPGQEAPGQKAPGQEAPGQKAPGQKAPGEKAPGQEAPGQEALDTGELTVCNFVSSALLPLILCKEEVREPQPEEPKELRVDLNTFYAPRMNYDFRNLKDDTECARGGEPYRRPCGWFRFALKVVGKYPDGDAWLGPGGWRNQSVAGEWPVSYHGTGREGQNPGTGAREPHEFGIFSTPDIKLAEQDAELHKEFTSKNGKTYRVIMQNRINPEHRVRKSDSLWLVRVPLEVHALTDRKKRKEEMKRIVDQSIRPYGVLLKEM